MEANRERDQDGWLRRSVVHHRMLVFLDARRWAEALREGGEWAQLGFEDVSQRWMHATATARALVELGREREAVSVLEGSLAYQDEKYLPSALGVLSALARLSVKLAEPLAPKWLKIAEAVAESHGVEMPSDGTPARAILALEEVVRSRQ